MTSQLPMQMDRRPDCAGALGALAVAEEELQRLGADESVRWELRRAIYLVRVAQAHLRDHTIGVRWWLPDAERLQRFTVPVLASMHRLIALEAEATKQLSNPAVRLRSATLRDHLAAAQSHQNLTLIPLKDLRLVAAGKRWTVTTPRNVPLFAQHQMME